MFSFQRISGGGNPFIHDKITSDHITSIINNAATEDDHQYKFASSNRWFNLIYFSIIILVLLLLIFYLPENKLNILDTIFKVLAGAIAGFGGGVYFSYRRKN